MRWEQVEIAQLGEVITGNTPPRKNPELYGNYIPFIKPTDIEIDRRFTPNPEECYSELGYEKYRKSLIPKGATCVVTIGSIGKKITQAITDCFINQAVNAVIPSVNYDADFVFYLLKNNLDKVKGLDSGTSSGRENVSKSSFSSIEVKVVKHLPTQRKIANILSAYDELIENNLKRIKLFEEKAQLHYKELISNGNTEKRYFEEFCSIIHGYAFKSTDFSEDKTFDVVVRMGNFREGGGLQFENNTKYLTEHFEYNPKYKLEANDLVMVLSDVTREGRIIGNVGFVPANDKTYLLNQRVGKIVSDEKYKVWLYATFNSKEFKDYCLSCANSATVLNFNNKDLFKFKITIPKETELKAFTEKVNPIFTLISSLGEQNSKLREARDILLPRLMSGQIEV